MNLREGRGRNTGLGRLAGGASGEEGQRCWLDGVVSPLAAWGLL